MRKRGSGVRRVGRGRWREGKKTSWRMMTGIRRLGKRERIAAGVGSGEWGEEECVQRARGGWGCEMRVGGDPSANGVVVGQKGLESEGVKGLGGKVRG